MNGNQEYTSLSGSEVVRKDDLRIEFRGLLDGTMARTAYCATIARREGNTKLEAALSDINACLMGIMSAHVLGKEVKTCTVDGIDLELIHEMSHDPMRYFGCGHFIPSPDMGEAIAYLNVLRTATRDCERAFIRAYSAQKEPNTDDIAKALNRISSAVYVLMCKYSKQNKD